MLALLGLEAVFKIVPWAYAVAKFIGAIYLIYIAWRMWLGACDEVKTKDEPVYHSFKQGVMINVLNPKSVLFAAAILIAIFPVNMTLFENAIIVINHFVVEVLFYTLLAMAMNTQAIKTRYLRAKIYIDRTASFVLGALGLRILISK